jgi:hypothetical protein
MSALVSSKIQRLGYYYSSVFKNSHLSTRKFTFETQSHKQFPFTTNGRDEVF